jgi:hypothetical protein
MDDLKNRLYPYVQFGVPYAAMSDLYRAKYGMPLDNESHERYIATKVPIRKNKDYRARFRSYSFGYPVIILMNLLSYRHIKRIPT